MNSRQIKQGLKAKGYELIDLKVLRSNSVSQTEWLFKVPDLQNEKILELGSGFFCKQDFSDGYLGGDAEYMEECLAELPNLKLSFNYKDMMALRSAYRHGIRNDETRAAATQYMRLKREGKLAELKGLNND